LVDFCGDAISYELPPTDRLTIKTLEGPLEAQRGDWIIKGTKGEFYPCKPDIFEEIYESVND